MAFESLSQKLTTAFKKLRGKGKLSEEDIKLAMREVRIALLEADVNILVAKDFVKTVSERALGAEVMDSLTPAQQVIKIVNEELTALMGSENSRIKFANHGPTVIMMCGLQGAGKTTHTAKLAKMYFKQGHRPLVAALDIYRPAAIEQLEVVAKQAGVPVFQMGKTDPVIVAKNAYNHAKDYGNDILILDTAGRLHVDEAAVDPLDHRVAHIVPLLIDGVLKFPAIIFHDDVAVRIQHPANRAEAAGAGLPRLQHLPALFPHKRRAVRDAAVRREFFVDKQDFVGLYVVYIDDAVDVVRNGLMVFRLLSLCRS